MEYLYIGKLVNTHGIKGEVRLLSKFRHKDKVFVKDFKFYVGKDKKEYIVETYRRHKNFDMVLFKDNYDINLIEHLKGSLVYINKEDLKLDKNVFLSIDLIGFDVIINDKLVGVINDVLDTPANEVLVLDTGDMIPYVNAFIKNIDMGKRRVIVNDVIGRIS